MAKNDPKPEGEKEQKQPSPFTVLRPVATDDARLTRNGAGDDGEQAQIGDLFEKVGVYTAKTSKTAIALAVGEHGGGTYIAVPQRSFTPRTAEAVAAPRVKWS